MDEIVPLDWVQDPHTLKLRKRYLEQRKEAHERLMSACEHSTDPDVRGMWERYEATRKFSDHLGGGKIGSRDDGT